MQQMTLKLPSLNLFGFINSATLSLFSRLPETALRSVAFCYEIRVHARKTFIFMGALHNRVLSKWSTMLWKKLKSCWHCSSAIFNNRLLDMSRWCCRELIGTFEMKHCIYLSFNFKVEALPDLTTLMIMGFDCVSLDCRCRWERFGLMTSSQLAFCQSYSNKCLWGRLLLSLLAINCLVHKVVKCLLS